MFCCDAYSPGIMKRFIKCLTGDNCLLPKCGAEERETYKGIDSDRQTESESKLVSYMCFFY